MRKNILLLLVSGFFLFSFAAYADTTESLPLNSFGIPTSNPYVVERIYDGDQTIDAVIVPGPPEPPAGYERRPVYISDGSTRAAGDVVLQYVPAMDLGFRLLGDLGGHDVRLLRQRGVREHVRRSGQRRGFSHDQRSLGHGLHQRRSQCLVPVERDYDRPRWTGCQGTCGRLLGPLREQQSRPLYRILARARSRGMHRRLHGYQPIRISKQRRFHHFLPIISAGPHYTITTAANPLIVTGATACDCSRNPGDIEWLKISPSSFLDTTERFKASPSRTSRTKSTPGVRSLSTSRATPCSVSGTTKPAPRFTSTTPGITTIMQ